MIVIKLIDSERKKPIHDINIYKQQIHLITNRLINTHICLCKKFMFLCFDFTYLKNKNKNRNIEEEEKIQNTQR